MNMSTQKWQETIDYLNERIKLQPKIGLILGSGLGVLADEIENPTKISYEDIPGFPVSTVEGHAGQLVIGELNGVEVIAMQGRFHYYEGYGLDVVTYPVRIMKEFGVEMLLVTNAAGGVNRSFQAGDLMLITDHINNTGQNPLIGENIKEHGVRFPDMSSAYDQKLQQIAKQTAESISVHMQEGVYVWNTGPSYETPAEIRMLEKMGGDAVGMSTVPEVTVARQAGIKCIGISCISNMAAGILDQPLTHDEVIETTEKVRESFLQLVKQLIHNMSKEAR